MVACPPCKKGKTRSPWMGMECQAVFGSPVLQLPQCELPACGCRKCPVKELQWHLQAKVRLLGTFSKEVARGDLLETRIHRVWMLLDAGRDQVLRSFWWGPDKRGTVAPEE